MEDTFGCKDINTQIFAALETDTKSSFGEVTMYFWPDNITFLFITVHRYLYALPLFNNI